jgi:hypothetical protein
LVGTFGRRRSIVLALRIVGFPVMKEGKESGYSDKELRTG